MRCTDCEFHVGCNSNLIEPLGPDRSDYLVVLDSPTATDDRFGNLLSGDGGKKLRYLFECAGINVESVHFTTAIRCFPVRPVKKVHLDACAKYLGYEFKTVQPKIIIVMGATALTQVMGEKTIGDWRGEFHEIDFVDTIGGKERSKSIKVMCTYGPNACLQKWEFDEIVIRDLKRAKKFVKDGQLPKKPELKFETITSLARLKEVALHLSEQPKFAYDFETTGFKFHKHKIISVGFCSEPGHAFVVPYYVYNDDEMKKFDSENLEIVKSINSFVTKDCIEIQSILKIIFGLKDIKKIAHNGKFDNQFAAYNGFPVRNFWFDTVIAHALVDENKPHDLTFCLDWYNIPYGNYEREIWDYVNKTKSLRKPYSYIPPKILHEYLAKDVDGTFRLHKYLIRDLKSEGMENLFLKQQMPLLRLMQELEYIGIKTDIIKLQNISKDFTKVLSDIDEKMKNITNNPTFNPNSPKQLSEYLSNIGAVGNTGDKQTKGGSWSTDESVLSVLAQKKKVGRVPRLILESRTLGKLKSNYLDGKDGESGILEYVDDKYFVHYVSNIHTPRTGRISISSPAMQTIPRPNPKYPEANIRQLFIPSQSDYLMFSVDFKQLEMRVAAYLSQDEVMVKEIQQGVDIHSRNAIVLGKCVDFLPADVTEEKFISAIKYSGSDPEQQQLCSEWSELRTLVKALGFGLNYGMEASTLAKDHGKDEDEMQSMIDAYFDKYAGLAVWREDQCNKVLNDGLLVLPETGRKRRFFSAANWFNSEYGSNIRKREMDIQSILRQAMNFPIQGYANEIFVAGKLKFFNRLKKEKMGSRLLLSLHDGILGEGPKSEMVKVWGIAKECLERVLGSGKLSVPLQIDFDLYDRWSGTKIKLEGI